MLQCMASYPRVYGFHRFQIYIYIYINTKLGTLPIGIRGEIVVIWSEDIIQRYKNLKELLCVQKDIIGTQNTRK